MNRPILLALGIIGILCIGRLSNAASNPAPGLEPYTPTKLEWLQVEAQTELSESSRCYRVNFAMRPPETIIAMITYETCLSKTEAETIGQQDLEAVRSIAEKRAWSWVKVEKDVTPSGFSGLVPAQR